MLKSVDFHLMTSKRNLSKMNFEKVEACWIQTKACKTLTAKLKNFEVHDSTQNLTNYRIIAESMDNKVFDCEILMYDRDPNTTADDMKKVDLDVILKMGQIRLVFLMKFINDFLAFIEPFNRARDMVVEQAVYAWEESEKRIRNAYANKTRARLNVRKISNM